MNNEELIAFIEGKLNELIAQMREEFAASGDVAELEASVNEVKSALKNVTNADAENKISAKVADLEKILEKHAKKISEVSEVKKENGKELTMKSYIKEGFESDAFRNFVANDSQNKSVALPRMVKKDYALTSGRTGLVMVSDIRQFISTEFGRRKLYIRDLLAKQATDGIKIVYDKMTSVTQYSSTNTENGNLAASNFTTSEQTDSVTRLGNYNDVSNNAVQSANWATERYSTLMEDAILYKEDFLCLYGSGAGNDLKGIKNNSRSISMTGPTFAALAFDTVATYNGGAQSLVTFVAAHGLVNGYNITIANATHAGYNATFAVNVYSDTQILLDVAYVAEAANLVDAWTGVTYYHLVDKIDNAGTVDAVMAAISLMKSYDVNIDGILMNPADATLIVTDKGTTGMPTAQSYIYSVERRGMDLFIGGIPVIESNAVKAGDIFVGEWSPANIMLFEYQPIGLQFISDATLAIANKVRFMADEQIAFVVFNPFAFGYGNLTTIKADIEKP